MEKNTAAEAVLKLREAFGAFLQCNSVANYMAMGEALDHAETVAASHPAPQAAAEGVGSIGDDTTFLDLITDLTGSVEELSHQRPAAFQALVAYIDSRAAPERAAIRQAGADVLMALRKVTPEMTAAAEGIEDLYRRGTPDTWGRVYRAMLDAALAAPAPTGESLSVPEPIKHRTEAIRQKHASHQSRSVPQLVRDVEYLLAHIALLTPAAGGPRHD